MGISKVAYAGQTLVDLTEDTVDAFSLKAGRTAHGADGEAVEGLLGADLSFTQGGTLNITLVLRDADGAAYALSDGEVLKLHMFHGADTIDAESADMSFSVPIPASTVIRPWHWWIRLVGTSKDWMVANGDAQCLAGATDPWLIAGLADRSRSVADAHYPEAYVCILDENPSAIDYWFENTYFRVVSMPNAELSDRGAYNAFRSNTLLSAIEMPKLQKISGGSFDGLYSLRSAEFPALVTMAKVFRDCALQALELPAAESIGGVAYSNFFQLLILPGETMCSLSGSGGFYKSNVFNLQGRIYVNDDLVDQYKSATNWVRYADHIYPISDWDGTIPPLPASWSQQ